MFLQVVLKQDLDNSRALLEEQLSSPGTVDSVHYYIVIVYFIVVDRLSNDVSNLSHVLSRAVKCTWLRRQSILGKNIDSLLRCIPIITSMAYLFSSKPPLILSCTPIF